MAGTKNLTNDYQIELGDLFEEMPKSVIAAIAVSALTLGGDYLDEAAVRAADEWQVLFDNGIVPQKPGKIARSLMTAAHSD